MRKQRRQKKTKKQPTKKGGGRGDLRGTLGSAFVEYGVVRNPFNNRYAYDTSPGSMTTRFKIKQQMGGSVSGIPVVIKGRPSYIYSKGLRIVPTTK
jgi:hypothetical protein